MSPRENSKHSILRPDTHGPEDAPAGNTLEDGEPAVEDAGNPDLVRPVPCPRPRKLADPGENDQHQADALKDRPGDQSDRLAGVVDVGLYVNGLS